MGNAVRQEAVIAALEPGVCLPLPELVQACDLNYDAVSQGLRGLIIRGLVERAERGCYGLTKAGIQAKDAGVSLTSESNYQRAVVGEICVRKVSLKQRLWRALRILRKATLKDLLALAATGEESAAANNARHYLKVLADTGFVHRFGRRGPGGVLRYRLIRDTGPKAPVMRRHEVEDLNTGEVYPYGQ